MNRLYDDFRHSDRLLTCLSAAAIAYSLLLIFSLQRAGSYNYIRPQLIAAVIGFIAATITAQADYRILLKKWYIAAIFAIVLAGAVFLFGMRINGTDDAAWISLPWGTTVQPSEFIKPCFILTFTHHVCYCHEKSVLNKPWAVLSLLLHAAIPMGIIHLQGDDGTALIFGAIFFVISMAAGIKWRYFTILVGLAAVGTPFIWNYLMNDPQRNRLLALFDTQSNTVTDYTYQQYQGRLSLANGGMYGTGFMHGQRVASGIVPEQENDFILSVAGEEFGFLGCMLAMALLFAILLLILYNAKKAPTLAGSLLCAGVFAVIAAQTILNLGMVLGLLPVIGVTLPLFSAGGSSLTGTLLCLGLVQSVRIHPF